MMLRTFATALALNALYKEADTFVSRNDDGDVVDRTIEALNLLSNCDDDELSRESQERLGEVVAARARYRDVS